MDGRPDHPPQQPAEERIEQHRELCLSAGMDGYLAKPYNLAQLGDLLDQFLSRSRRSG